LGSVEIVVEHAQRELQAVVQKPAIKLKFLRERISGGVLDGGDQDRRSRVVILVGEVGEVAVGGDRLDLDVVGQIVGNGPGNTPVAVDAWLVPPLRVREQAGGARRV